MDDELATEIETAESSHPYVVTTEATLELHGPRQLILDTETTGFISRMETGLLKSVPLKW